MLVCSPASANRNQPQASPANPPQVALVPDKMKGRGNRGAARGVVNLAHANVGERGEHTAKEERRAEEQCTLKCYQNVSHQTHSDANQNTTYSIANVYSALLLLLERRRHTCTTFK